MSVTPAEVANDLAAQGWYFERGDRDVARLCHDAATAIRTMLAGEVLDGRTWNGLHVRLLDRPRRYDPESQIARSLQRGLATLEEMRRESRTP
jgi:hypothetical protein